MKHEHLKGAKVAIVGMGRSHLNFSMSLAHSAKYDEVWGINVIGAIFRDVHRTFMMDPPSHFLDGDKPGDMTSIMRDMVTSRQLFPIYSSGTDPRCPSVVEYPLGEVIQATGLCYFNNTATYALAYALYQEVAEVNIFGLDYTYSNVNIAESGRACAEFWIAMLSSKGTVINIAPESSLMDTNVPAEKKLYGYSLLPDPLVADFNVPGQLTIQPLSHLKKIVNEDK